MGADTIRDGEREPLLRVPRSSRSESGQVDTVRPRRRSSAFLAFLFDQGSLEGDGHQDARGARTINLLLLLSTMYYAGVMMQNAFIIEEVQTLSCAEYYYPSTSSNVALPLGGDPTQLCSNSFIEKRTSQVTAYTDTFSSLTGCISSLVIAKYVLPRFSRRTVGMFSMALATLTSVALSLVPTHYSLDPTVPSTSMMHPTTAQYLLVAIFTIANLFGTLQVSFVVLMQVMVLDVCREDEKTSSFAKLVAANLIGATVASILLLAVFPFFDLHFSILHHTGPCSPFLAAAGMMALTFILVVLFLPETKPTRVQGHVESTSNNDDASRQDGLVDGEDAASASFLCLPWLRPVVEAFSLFGYLLPYRSTSDAKWDYKLSAMLVALLFGDTLTLVWSNLIVFASSRLDFGPEDVAVFLGVLGSSKGLYNLFGLPVVVNKIREMVKKRVRQEIVVGETAVAQGRERYIVETDKIVAMVSLGFDVVGWICMGLAAKQLSLGGIYGSLAVLVPGTGAIPSIQALAVDLFLAQKRPTRDPLAARDAFITLFALFQNATTIVGPILNNAIYNWSIDHNVSFLVFFTTAVASLISLLLVASVGSLFK